jgi:hypothetical protein
VPIVVAGATVGGAAQSFLLGPFWAFSTFWSKGRDLVALRNLNSFSTAVSSFAPTQVSSEEVIDTAKYSWYERSCPCGLPAGECKEHPRARASQVPPERESARSADPNGTPAGCPYCSGFGIALILSEGKPVRVGEIVVNQNPIIRRCPTCHVNPPRLPHDFWWPS